ncbi:MAG: ABC transporter transmembrane domain-containing protein, partial [Chitinophagales bacterium]
MNLEKGFWSVVARLSPYKREAILNMSFNIFAVLFSLVSLVMIVPFLRILFNIQDLVTTPPIFEWSSDYLINHFNYTLSSIIIERDKVAALFFVCLIIILVFLLKNLFRYAAIYFMAIIRNGVVRDIRKAIFDKIMLLPIGYFSEKRKGDLLTRVTADVQEIEWSIMSTLEVTVKEPITVIAYLGAMLLISWELTLFVLVVLPISGFIIGRVGKTLKSKSHMAQKRLANIMSIIEESLSGLRIIKGFNGANYQRQRFSEQNEAHFEVMTDMARRRDLASPLSEVLSITVVAIVLY